VTPSRWPLRVDFAARVLEAEACLTLDGDGDTLDLDTRDLTISAVDDDAGRALGYELAPPQPVSSVVRLRIARGSPSGCVSPTGPPPQRRRCNGSTNRSNSQCQPIQARSLVRCPIRRRPA